MNKFFKCNECKKVFLDLSRNENPTGLVELKANTVDASNEKHIPDVHVEGDKVNVVVVKASRDSREIDFEIVRKDIRNKHGDNK